jgi:DnaK suppressor protein
MPAKKTVRPKPKKATARKAVPVKAGSHHKRLGKSKSSAKSRVQPKPAAGKKPLPTPAPVARSRPVIAPPAKPARPLVPSLSERPPLRVSLPPSADAEESDGADNASLLSGPRNVQPYIPKRGEQYMNKEQLDHFQQILNTWKRDLMEEVDRTVLHMKDEAANFPDPNDRATQESEFSLELRTRDRERKLIRKIDEALKRIEDGTYGYCLETGEEIGIKRLEARPVATLSVEAQERRERREKQYGDRDDRYR